VARKQSADKKKFFGDHLEIKPIFMQRPKSMEEVMAEAFSNSNTIENPSTIVEQTIVEQNAIVETMDSSAIVENPSTVANSATIANTTTVAKSNQNDHHNKNDKTHNEKNDKDSDKEVTLSEPVIVDTMANTTIVAKTAVANATVAVKTMVAAEIPNRLKADVILLRRMVTVKWQPLLEIEKIAIDSASYWQAYTKAWHWIEDEVVPYLDKDSKLALRRCYRKAFGDISAKGKFFAGQTSLAQEVGLSKRRIQDILEIFNLLGWVRKIAHHNRGGYKGTDYEMYLPPKAIEYFLEI